ncbi:tetratricopeptide repeat protein [Helicobacter sp. MIT 05-5294]|uniref:tetratricopeptide repeat protein n=1 Tax=Helicobacter sp. MIT 05-5294 TaxID=1548150 RepID=UPI00051FDB70|nr:tetratricopeptide repeat protein [Helicobacter sp. MIT 05-5294]TLD87274.1 tetratricopeptide repeat protein [Helicobacter sp. MIT 05-5294]
MKTLTLASIYEIQGHAYEAAEIYKTILEENPDNAEAKIALKRLVSNRKNYGKASEDMLNLFVQMDSEVEFNEFERWLLKLWN